MNKKRSIFFLSLSGVIFITLVLILELGLSCSSSKYVFCNIVFTITNIFGFYLLYFPFVFLFSLITYRMNDQVFKKWFNFAIWYLGLLTLFMFLMTSSPNGGGYIGIGDWFVSMLFFFLLFIFFIASVIIIVSKNSSLKKVR